MAASIHVLAERIKQKNHTDAATQELNLIRSKQRDAARGQYLSDFAVELGARIEVLRTELGSDGEDLSCSFSQGTIQIGKVKAPSVRFTLARSHLFSGFRAEYTSFTSINPHGNPHKMEILLRIDADENVTLECEGRPQSVAEIADSLMAKLFTV